MLRDVIVATTDDSCGFYLTGNNSDVGVRGTVVGRVPFVLGNAGDVGQHLHGTATGDLIGTGAYGIGASIQGSSRIENEGEIRGAYFGLHPTPDTSSTVGIDKDGLIQSYDSGIYAVGSAGTVNLGGGYDPFDNRGGLVRGTVHGGLADDTFVSGALVETFSGGVFGAQDSNDRFNFRTTDKTLRLDRNGNADGGLMRVAALQDGAVVSYTDICLSWPLC